MNNTIANVPRELLDRASNLAFQTQHYPLHEELRSLLSAPSPAGVDGLEVVAWRIGFPNNTGYKVYEQRQPWAYEQYGVPSVIVYEVQELCRLSDAQAIIDGLRGEVGAQRIKTCTALKERNDAREERDHLAQCLKFARTTMAVVANNANLRGVEYRSLVTEVKRIDAALSAVCAAAPNIAPTSEHKVPEGIVSITRSLGRAIVRFNTSEQLNEFYRAAKSALPTERSGQIRSTPR